MIAYVVDRKKLILLQCHHKKDHGDRTSDHGFRHRYIRCLIEHIRKRDTQRKYAQKDDQIFAVASSVRQRSQGSQGGSKSISTYLFPPYLISAVKCRTRNGMRNERIDDQSNNKDKQDFQREERKAVLDHHPEK